MQVIIRIVLHFRPVLCLKVVRRMIMYVRINRVHDKVKHIPLHLQIDTLPIDLRKPGWALFNTELVQQ
jgi:hypothetical protein